MREGRVILVEPIWIGARIRDLKQMEDGTIVLFADNAEFIELVEQTDGIESDSDSLESISAGTELSHVVQSCNRCHAFSPEERRDTAPPLHRVFGQPIASGDFPGYSTALRSKPGKWDEKSLAEFIRDPQACVPGTTMPSAFIGDPETLQRLIQHLKRIAQKSGQT